MSVLRARVVRQIVTSVRQICNTHLELYQLKQPAWAQIVPEHDISRTVLVGPLRVQPGSPKRVPR